jgi:thiol-disulfide isomerase/thioredoxin
MSVQHVVEITDVETWENTVEKAKKPVVVMFYSPNCPHCQAMDPYFQQYSKEFQGKVAFVKVNIVDNVIVAAKYGVMGTPTFKFFCNGRPFVDRVGEMYPALIKKFVEDSLQDSPDCANKATWIDFGITGYG